MSTPKTYVGSIFRHDERRCPKCGHKFDATCGFSPDPIQADRAPAPGDLVVCGGCLELLICEERMTFRTLTSAELCGLKASGDEWAAIERARQAWRDADPRIRKPD